MIRYDEIKQQTLEWFEIKYRKIGGTLSKCLFVDSDTLFIDLLSQNLEEFEPVEGFSSDATERGNDMEPFALEYLSAYSGIDFKTTGWIQSEESDILGISPDGISECERYCAEIKCLGKKAHTSILLNNEVPKEYIAQVLHYFTINQKLEKLYWIAFRPESIKHFVYIFTPESVIDMGWKCKVEVKQYGVKGQEIKPKIETSIDYKTIKEWSKIAIEEANKIELKITETINKLKF